MIGIMGTSKNRHTILFIPQSAKIWPISVSNSALNSSHPGFTAPSFSGITHFGWPFYITLLRKPQCQPFGSKPIAWDCSR
jgi:hypothetical protein